jgi:hypothetical protein
MENKSRPVEGLPPKEGQMAKKRAKKTAKKTTKKKTKKKK